MHLVPCQPPKGELDSAPRTSLTEDRASETWDGFWCNERYYTRCTSVDGRVEWFTIADSPARVLAFRMRRASNASARRASNASARRAWYASMRRALFVVSYVGRRTLTQDGQRTLTQDGQRTLTQDGQRALTQDGQRALTQDGRRTVLVGRLGRGASR